MRTAWGGCLILAAAAAVLLTGVYLFSTADPAASRWVTAAAPWWLGWLGCLSGYLVVCRSRVALPRGTLGFVLVVAVVARLGTLPAPDTLSDDWARYLWDGRVVLAGGDPYAATPNQRRAGRIADLDAGHERLLAAMNSPDYHSVYPPISQAVFAAAWQGGKGLGQLVEARPKTLTLGVLRAVLLLADLLTMVLLLRWLKRAGHQTGPPLVLRPPSGSNAWGPILLWAWSPLPIIELIGGMHTEALLGPPLAAAAAWAARRPLAAAVALGVAAGVKLWPLVLVPALLYGPGNPRRRIVACAVGVVVAGLLVWPMLRPAAAANVAESLRLYSSSFAFNHGLFDALLAVLREPADPGAAYNTASGVMRVLLLLGLGFVYVKTATRGTCGQAAVIALVGAATVYLMTHTTLHPWYPSWVLVLLPLLGRGMLAAVWLSLVSPLSYLAYAREPVAVPAWALAVQWVPAVALLAFHDARRLGQALRQPRQTPLPDEARAS